MYWSLPNEIFDSTRDIFVFHRGAHPFLIVYLPIDCCFVIMLPLLDVDVDFGELLCTKLSLQFCPDAQCYIESEATGRCCWDPDY